MRTQSTSGSFITLIRAFLAKAKEISDAASNADTESFPFSSPRGYGGQSSCPTAAFAEHPGAKGGRRSPCCQSFSLQQLKLMRPRLHFSRFRETLKLPSFSERWRVNVPRHTTGDSQLNYRHKLNSKEVNYVSSQLTLTIFRASSKPTNVYADAEHHCIYITVLGNARQCAMRSQLPVLWWRLRGR